MSTGKHTTIRLSDEGRARLARLAPDYENNTAAIEDALYIAELGKLAFGEQVAAVTRQIAAAIKAGEEEGPAVMELATLLRSTTAAWGVAKAIKAVFGSGEE